MSGASVAAKVKKGLRNANKAVGENPSPIYKEIKTSSGGDGITPPTETITNAQLVDAIFKSYDQKAIGESSSILAGDRQFVCNGDVPLAVGDTVKHGTDKWLVKFVDIKSPAGIPLAYIAQVRKQ